MRSTARYFFAATAALLPLMAAACSDQAPTAVAPAVEQSVYSVMDAKTGEPRAINLPATATAPAGPLAVIVPPECDPDFGCDPPPPPPDPCAGVSPLVSSSYTAYYGVDPYTATEAAATYTANCAPQVVTGLGARVDGNDNVTTLWIEFGTLNVDGTVTGRHVVKTGSDAYHDVEAWVSVPTNVNGSITSVSMGQGNTHNLRTLRANYQTFGIGSNGHPVLQNDDHQVQGGVDPFSSSIDLSWSLPYYTNNVAIGFGFRSANSKMKTGRTFVGVIN